MENMLILAKVASVVIMASGVYGAVTWKDMGPYSAEGGRVSRFMSHSLGAMMVAFVVIVCSIPFFVEV